MVRLSFVGIDLVKDGEIDNYREHERDLLLNIRNGFHQQEDGFYKPEFFDMIDSYKPDFDKAKGISILPRKVDMKATESFVMDTNMAFFENTN